MIEKIRAWIFKRNIKRTQKYCDKYKECEGCPFAYSTAAAGVAYEECMLTQWENGADRYPYEYEDIKL